MLTPMADHRMPAFCPACGLVFDGPVTMADGAHHITIVEVTTKCPRCGHDSAELPEGTFSVINDTIEVLAGPQLTVERMRNVQTILEAARRENLTTDEIASQVEDEEPGLGELLRKYAGLGNALIQILLATLQILIALNTDTASREDVARAIDEAVEMCRKPENVPPPAPPEDPPPSATRRTT